MDAISDSRILENAGMSPHEAARKAILLQQCDAALSDVPATPPAHFFVPGRVELLGKHTDYAGGRSLLCAVERGICVAVRARDDARITVAALDVNGRVDFPLSPDIRPEEGWANYVMTAARRAARNFPGPLRGADMALAGDLPHAAGMSSSSALIVATFLALRRVNHLQEHPAYRENIRSNEDLAGYLGAVENGQTFGTLIGDRGVGTFGGSQDHTAILCSQAGRVSQYAFCPVRREATIPWPAASVLAIGVSGVVSEKTGAAMDLYNRASRRTAAILDLWRAKTGRPDATLIAAIRSSEDALGRLRQFIAEAPQPWSGASREDLSRRLEQLDAESERIIPAAAIALREGRLAELGRLVDESQANAEALLGNQVPETIALCRGARNLGATAASAFGAGFGGAVWALISEKRSGEFLANWKSQYDAAFPARAAAAKFFVTRPGPAALEI